MALNWRWNECCGEAMFKQMHEGEEDKIYTTNLYVGNAYLIFIYEWKEGDANMYRLSSFWVDKTHMNRCLGIDKKDKTCYNIYNTEYEKLIKIRINKKKCKHTKGIVSALIQAFDNIKIEIYSED